MAVYKRKGKEQTSRLITQDGVAYFTFSIFDDYPVVCGFSTRLGGVSEGIFSSMNLSFTRGDREEAVWENYNRIGSVLGFRPEQVVCTDQVHDTKVLRVTKEHCGMGMTKPRIAGIDGLMTSERQVPLATFYADCVPLFFYDPVKQVIAASHSGWRGTVQRMGAVTVARMQEEYGCNSSDLLCAIGPSICRDCYEISEDVAREFQTAFKDDQIEEILRDDHNGKYHLDLWRCNQIVLEEAGIPKEQISIPDVCTCCNPDLLFSHRASQGKRGNLAGFMMLP
ncbi:MAG: peptidoglycan editing factor PgeF [Lachnospiraceae bacterium]